MSIRNLLPIYAPLLKSTYQMWSSFKSEFFELEEFPMIKPSDFTSSKRILRIYICKLLIEQKVLSENLSYAEILNIEVDL